MQEHINQHKNSLIIFPREHGKTSQVIGRVIHEIGKDVELVHKIVCSADDLAGKRALAIREQIRSNQRIHNVFPHLKPSSYDWLKTKFTVERTVIDPNATVEACSVLATGTGDRADWLWIDDPVDARNALFYPALRPAVKEAFYNVWMNLLSPNGRVVYIATLWHQDDLTHELMKNPEFAILRFDIDEKFTPIWPERWDTARLRQKRAIIGPRAFDRGYRNIALSSEEQIFKDIEKCVLEDVNEVDIQNMKKGEVYIGMDLAISKSPSGKYTAICVSRVTNEKKYVMDVFRAKIGSVASALILLYLCSKYSPERVLVENNAYQDALIEWIKVLKGLLGNYKESQVDQFYHDHLKDDLQPSLWVEIKPHFRYITKISSALIKPFRTGKNKADEYIGLPGLAGEITAEEWAFPKHEFDCDCGICVLVNEAKFYPIAQTSDCLLAWWFSNRAAKVAQPRIRVV